MKRKIINCKDKGLIEKTLKEVLSFVVETPQFYSLAWDFSKKKSTKELQNEGSDYLPQILIKKECYYLLQVEETWGGGVNIIFEPSKKRPMRMIKDKDNIVNKCFVLPKFTWEEYLSYVQSRKIGNDLSAIACQAMGVDY